MMAAEPPSSAYPLSLLHDAGFRREIAALRAKATLKQLLGEAPNYRWSFTAERAVRNAIALHLAVRRAAIEAAEHTQDMRNAARVAAQLWEGLGTLEERTNRTTALMNAAVSYELAGYQANAICLARTSVDPRNWSTEPTLDGIAAAFVQRLLLRVRAAAAEMVHPPDEMAALSHGELAVRIAVATAAAGLASCAHYLLSGDVSSMNGADEALDLALVSLSALGEVRSANLISNLRALLPSIQAKSTWTQIGNSVPRNLRWQRYLRVLARGLGSTVVDSRSVSELWPSQQVAVDKGLFDRAANMIVRMPTSAGKTRVAEMAIVHTLVANPSARCLYVAPYRALVSEIEDSFANLFSELGYAASSVFGAYEEDVLDQLLLEDQVLVLTPEKLDLILRLSPNALEGVELIVLDEGQIVGDRERGARYELLVTRLRRQFPNARMLLLSAVVPQETLQDFAAWLRTGTDGIVESTWRPSIQRLAYLDWNGVRGVLRYDPSGDDESLAQFVPDLVRQRRFEYVHPTTERRRRPVFPETSNKSQVAAALAFELAAQGPVLVFCAQTDWTEAVGKALAFRVELAAHSRERSPDVFLPRDAPRSYLVAREWLGENDATTVLLAQGIGVHHGRQPEAVRTAIEEDFRRRRLGVLAATTTLGQGVNLPVRTVIIHTCRRYDEATGQQRRVSAREYWNIAGRAGRAGEETDGTVVHIGQTAQDRADYEYYRQARGAVEPVESTLFRLLVDLVQGRISPDALASRLDAELLALLVEEAAGGLDEAAMTGIIADSLAAVQAAGRNYGIAPLAQALAAGARSITGMVPSADERRIFSSTGLRTTSCSTIADHVRSHTRRMTALLPNAAYEDRDELLDLLLEGLSPVDEMQPRVAYSGSYLALLNLWLEGRPVAEATADLGTGEDVSRFIADYFAYRLPWGISSYLRIARHVLQLDQLSSVVIGLSSLVKYGVPTVEAAWAIGAGVADRQTAIRVAGLYIAERRTSTSEARDFRRWLGDVQPESLVEEYGLPEAALPDLNRALLRSARSPILARLDQGEPLLPFNAVVRALRRSTGLVSSLLPDAVMQVRRDYDSPYRNSTRLDSMGQTIAYLRRGDAQVVAPEIDAGMEVEARLVSIARDESGPTVLTVRLQQLAEGPN